MRRLPGLHEGKEVRVQIGKHPGYHQVHVVDLTGSGIGLEVPFDDEGRLMTVRPGSRVRVEYSSETGIYAFDGVVAEVVEEGTPWFRIGRPRKLERKQRRRFFRLVVSVPVWWSLLDEGGSCHGPFNEASTGDLSGGGLRFAAEEAPPVGSRLLLKVDIGDGPPIEVVGEVVRSVQQDDGCGRVVSVDFTQIDEADRDALIRYLFRKQGELRRKGLL